MSSNENGNENDKTMSSKEDDNQTMNQKNNNTVKELNDLLDKIIDKSKSFEEQIKSIRKLENLGEYYYINDYGDKELEFKIFELKLAHLSISLAKSYLNEYLVIHLKHQQIN